MVWGDDLSANKLKKTYVKGNLDISAGNVIVQNSGNLMVMSQTEGLASITFSTTNINIFDGENQYDMSYSTFGALNAIGVSFEESTGELLLRTKYISSSTISDVKKTLIGNVDTSCSLIVYGNTVCTMDSSINGVIRVGGGAFINDALDVVGDVSFGQRLFVGGDSSLNGFLTVVKDASLNAGLRVGGDSSLNGRLTVTRDVSFGAGLRVGGDSSLNGLLTVTRDVSFGAGLRVGGDSSLNGFLTVVKDVSINAGLRVGGDASLNGLLTVVKDASLNAGLRVGGDASLNGLLTVTRDVSFNAGLRVGGDSSLNGLLTVVRDVSLNAGLRVGGDVSLNGLLTVTRDASFNAGLRVGGDSSLNGFLTVARDVSLNAGLWINGDASLNSNLYVKNKIGIGKDASAGYALDVSGTSIARDTVYIRSPNYGLDVSGYTVLRSQIAIAKDISAGYSLDVSGYTYLRNSVGIGRDASSSYALDVSGASVVRGSFAVAKDISAGYSLDVSGYTYLRNSVGIGRDASSSYALDVSGVTAVREAIAIGKDISAGYSLDVSGRSLFRDTTYLIKDPSTGYALDVSGYTYLRNSVGIGRDASSSYALDISGATVVRGPIAIAKDISAAYALDVSGITAVRGPLVINKDISAGYMLDVSGISQFRGNVDISGVFTVYGQPLQAGASLNGNVQVGTNSGFVTVDKPQFYSDPSLFIFYTFDTSFNGGTSIANSGFGGATYDASLGPNFGSTNGVIDTSIKKFGTASLKNDPALNNKGAVTNTVPVSTQMSYSVWINKSSKPIAGDFDRVFELTNNVAYGQTENNTIALDISSSGYVFPVVYSAGTPGTNLISSPQLVPNVNYNVCDGNWNLVTWTLSGTQSKLYVNGDIVQSDTLTSSIPDTSRNRLIIAYYTTTIIKDFSGNLDNFRYYKDKVLTPVEIYQLYNDKYFTLDVCGGILANGSSLIYEPQGTKASANAGSLVLMHGDASGSSSIVFKSLNDGSDYAYIQYEENAVGSTGLNYGLLTIGVENDISGGTTVTDNLALYTSGGRGFVGINTKTPAAALDISGDILVNGIRAGRGGNAVASNTVFGAGALPINTTGYQNVAIGQNALQYTTTGYQNVAVGYNSLSIAVDISMNTAIGSSAGFSSNNYKGNKNTFLGYDTQLNNDFSNCTVIGAGARGTASNQVQLGNGCVAQAQSFNATSDYREKREIMDLDDSYTVDVLRPVSYKFIKNDTKMHIGFIAHEVQEHYPFLVQGEKDGPVPQSLNYNDLIGILTKELKDLKAEVRALKQELKRGV